MPKDDERKEMTQEEIDAREEKFRTFFTTSVAQVPEEMTRRDDENEEKPKSLLGRLLRREKGEQQESGTPEESRTGEIQLGGEEPEEPSDLELVLTMLAEASTTDIAKAEQPQGFDENQKVARRGGNVAGVARKALEAETGKPVVTAQNAESFRQLVTDIVTDAAQLPDQTEGERKWEMSRKATTEESSAAGGRRNSISRVNANDRTL